MIDLFAYSENDACYLDQPIRVYDQIELFKFWKRDGKKNSASNFWNENEIWHVSMNIVLEI